MSAEKRTKDHGTIRRWVEEHDGRPACVKSDKEKVGILTIEFGDFPGTQNVERIPWKVFFIKFDEENFTFIYDDTTETGERSHFCKIVGQEPEMAKPAP